MDGEGRWPCGGGGGIGVWGWVWRSGDVERRGNHFKLVGEELPAAVT